MGHCGSISACGVAVVKFICGVIVSQLFVVSCFSHNKGDVYCSHTRDYFEAIRGRPMACDGSLDMFSLGVVLFAMLSGTLLSFYCTCKHAPVSCQELAFQTLI